MVSIKIDATFYQIKNQPIMKDAILSNCCQAPLLKIEEEDYTICLNCYDALEEQEIYQIPDLSWKTVFLILLFLLLL